MTREPTAADLFAELQATARMLADVQMRHQAAGVTVQVAQTRQRELADECIALNIERKRLVEALEEAVRKEAGLGETEPVRAPTGLSEGIGAPVANVVDFG